LADWDTKGRREDVTPRGPERAFTARPRIHHRRIFRPRPAGDPSEMRAEGRYKFWNPAGTGSITFGTPVSRMAAWDLGDPRRTPAPDGIRKIGPHCGGVCTTQLALDGTGIWCDYANVSIGRIWSVWVEPIRVADADQLAIQLGRTPDFERLKRLLWIRGFSFQKR
jgi:hypothetical protein